MGVLRRVLERGQPMNLLGLDTQRLPARRQDMNLRCLIKNAFRQYGSGFDHMFATVEDQQHSPMPQSGDEAGDGIPFIDRKTESHPGSASDQKRIFERSQIDEMDQIAELLE